MSLVMVCEMPTPTSSTMNDATTAATVRSWQKTGIITKPADTSTARRWSGCAGRTIW
jgi:hypothetical protein